MRPMVFATIVVMTVVAYQILFTTPTLRRIAFLAREYADVLLSISPALEDVDNDPEKVPDSSKEVLFAGRIQEPEFLHKDEQDDDDGQLKVAWLMTFPNRYAALFLGYAHVSKMSHWLLGVQQCTHELVLICCSVALHIRLN